ncbi:hypothetical protein CC85DRAFT_287351 [Cutaneotrichosporon oleaginosum]|uniref:Uncharacterized protein n=1 Tax=Cutaneotrichosporon oleaginosum TaxID=879819 RepID=A0A0J0XHD8_9TREE|nr:uncharacterized protein CC85DRAFT_287351 [Cutaneotrichosporon oleaginosum]KLT40506.1 hypothetical protein CC85DRAFT_287351 [Cutaneotrichosporon oleaginosum]TXT08422.1 hypothetical protein COLE_05346 [Cutaneotrichosporon oleaginosum]
MSSELVVRQSEDWTRVLVSSYPSGVDWVLAFSRDASGVSAGEPAALALLRDAHTLHLEGRLEPNNAAHLETLCRPHTVHINNDSRGPRSSLGAPTLVISWRTASSYVLPDLLISSNTNRLVVAISDAGGPISPANRRFLPALPTLDVADVVLDFSRWDSAVVDPFVARALYAALAGLLVRGVRITLVDFARVFACMADASTEMRPTRWTALPRRAEDALKFRVREALRARASPRRANARALELAVRETLGGIAVVDTPPAKL